MSTETSTWTTSHEEQRPETLSPWVEMPRRAPRYLLIGLALMVGFAVVFGVLALRADPATPVLAVARPVPAGATITDADLKVVRLVPAPGMEVITEAERTAVVDKTAAVPLTEGSLLSPGQLGAPEWPAAGRSVVAVTVPGGRLPAGLVAGSQVSVLHDRTPEGRSSEVGLPVEDVESGGPDAVTASVVKVVPQDLAGTAVVSLLMSTDDAHRVAAAGDDLAVVLESPAGHR